MRQLKIKKSIAREQTPFINEWLKSKDFCLDEFVKKIAEAGQLIDGKEDCIIGDFQDLESTHTLAISHLHGRSYADLIADLREEGSEINTLRWLNARKVVSIAGEYASCGKPMQELLIAGMQGVKNAALAYNFNPCVSFGDYAASIIRRHVEQYVQTGDFSCAALCKEYKEVHSRAMEGYSRYLNANKTISDFIRLNTEKQQENIFANAKIGRCRKEVIKIADMVEWRKVDAAVHLPDDYDERDKFIRTEAFTLHDAIYCGECKDFVKPVGGEWCICAAGSGVRVPVREITDRDSLRNAVESLFAILENLVPTKRFSFREWRAEKGI